MKSLQGLICERSPRRSSRLAAFWPLAIRPEPGEARRSTVRSKIKRPNKAPPRKKIKYCRKTSLNGLFWRFGAWGGYKTINPSKKASQTGRTRPRRPCLFFFFSKARYIKPLLYIERQQPPFCCFYILLVFISFKYLYILGGAKILDLSRVSAIWTVHFWCLSRTFLVVSAYIFGVQRTFLVFISYIFGCFGVHFWCPAYIFGVYLVHIVFCVRFNK